MLQEPQPAKTFIPYSELRQTFSEGGSSCSSWSDHESDDPASARQPEIRALADFGRSAELMLNRDEMLQLLTLETFDKIPSVPFQPQMPQPNRRGWLVVFDIAESPAMQSSVYAFGGLCGL